jgi:linoleoyl-CoA desaturase
MPGYVFIHSKFYDLEKIKSDHPGGYLNLFESIENEEDCTPLFESCHAMKDINAIYSMMKDYEIQEEDFPKFKITKEILESKKGLKKFDFCSYHKISAEVKKILGRNYKVNTLWYYKVALLLLFYIFFYYHGIIKSTVGFNIINCSYAFLAGLFWIYVGFCTMHDGSHYGLFKTNSKNKFLNNDVISSIWHGWGLWNSFVWFKHHTYGHHSFTGIFGKDPDIIHGRPIFRKSEKDSKVIKFLGKIQDKIAMFILIFFPGMYVGQILSYFNGIIRGHVWKINLKNAFKHTPFYEKILYILSFSSLFTCSSYISVYFYLIGLNLNYAICIIPDHDTFESTIENDKETDDWAEMEIRKSANFNHNSKIFTEMNGGINFQIEHHLLPTVAHCHYEKISPVIKNFSEKNNIPYVQKKSIYDVYLSYKKMLEYVKVK